MMEERAVFISCIYRHFKGGEYMVIGVATHTETNERLVVYMDLESDKTWARPYAEFLAKVDREKYPDAQQDYRFELVGVEDEQDG